MVKSPRGPAAVALWGALSLTVGCSSSSVAVEPPPGNQPPTAAITSPADASSYVQGSSISFTGTASDPEDGALGGASLEWSSSRDGVLGTGTEVSATLSLGAHDVSLTATDSRGASSTDEILVTVEASSPPGNWSSIMSYGSASRERLKVKRPQGPATVPIFIHIPGGGWKDHTINSCNFSADQFVRETQWALVCVDFPPSSPTFSHPGHEQSVARAFDFIVSTLANQQNLDPSTVVAYGGSAGGHLAYRLAQLRPGRFVGVGAQAAPTCLTNWDTAEHGVDPRCPILSGTPAEAAADSLLGPNATPDVAWNASPLREFEVLPPVHIQHIIQDPIVPISQARVMRDSLQAHGMPLDYHEFQLDQQCEHGCGYFGHGSQLKDWLARLLAGS